MGTQIGLRKYGLIMERLQHSSLQWVSQIFGLDSVDDLHYAKTGVFLSKVRLLIRLDHIIICLKSW